MAVKKNIEDVQGKDNYPCGQQLLIHNGKVLKDETTLVDNNVSEDGFLVVMLSKVYYFITCFYVVCIVNLTCLVFVMLFNYILSSGKQVWIPKIIYSSVRLRLKVVHIMVCDIICSIIRKIFKVAQNDTWHGYHVTDASTL